MVNVQREENLSRLNNITRKEGWKRAVIGFLRRKDKVLYRQSTDESLIDWRFLLPIDKDSRVLDVGCGLGISSVIFSRICREVVSVDSFEKNLEFLRLKLDQEDIRNVHLVLSDNGKTPFIDGAFDVIVLRQRRSITAFSALLRSGGTLFVQTNGGQHNKMVSMLKREGFNTINLFFPLPDADNIQVVIPLNGPHLLRYYLDNLKGVSGFLQRCKIFALRSVIELRLFRFVWPHFYIVAIKS